MSDPQRLPRWVIPVLVAGLLLLWIGGPLLLWLLLRGPDLPAPVAQLLAQHPSITPALATSVERRDDDGRLLQRGWVVRHDDRELRVGRWESYGGAGRLTALGSFDEEGSGFYARWDDSGRLLWNHYYHRGREQRHRSYHSSGQLAQDLHRDADGAFNGSYRSWYEDGTLRFEGRYRSGARTGTWLYRRADGNKQLEEDYVDGVLRAKRRFAPDESGKALAHGRWTQWSAEGIVTETRWFDRGQPSTAPTTAPAEAHAPEADEPVSAAAR